MFSRTVEPKTGICRGERYARACMSVTNKQKPGGPTVRCVPSGSGVKVTIMNLGQAAIHLVDAPDLPLVHDEGGTIVVHHGLGARGVSPTRPLEPMAAVVLEVDLAALGRSGRQRVRARAGWFEAPIVAGELDDLPAAVALDRQHVAEAPTVELDVA
jgi:hypothetical protein